MNCFMCKGEKSKSKVFGHVGDFIEHLRVSHSIHNNSIVIALLRHLKNKVPTKVAAGKDIECFVCGIYLKNFTTLLQHFLKSHEYLGYPKEEFDRKIVKNRVTYEASDVGSSLTGKPSPKYYRISAGEHRHQFEYEWNNHNTSEVFLTISKLCLDCLDLKTKLIFKI